MTVDQLLRLQRAFDESRGIANLPDADTARDDDPLGRLEYALIGLTGEVGEIANIIKKARRGRAQGLTAEQLVPIALAEEVADVFSYLLKLADQAGIALGHAYLTKMCLNAHRFRRRPGAPPMLTVCGPPGSGKSTLVRALSETYGAAASYVERFEDNPFLDRLDQPPVGFDATASQRWFLDSVSRFVVAADGPPLILDQDPTAIVLVYGQLLVDRGEIKPQDYEDDLATLMRLETEQAGKLAGRTLVLLDAPAEVLADRCCNKPGPVLERAFLESVRERFRRVFTGLPNVVLVDAAQPRDEVLKIVRDIAADLA